MRTETVKIYELNELSETAKETAHENYLTNGFEWNHTDELESTLKAFESVFPVKIKHWEFDNNYAEVRFEMTCDSDVSDLTGLRLARYIYNNFYNELFKPKFIGSLKTNEYVQHKRIKSPINAYENGNRFNPYYSAIQKDTSCVLTGMCFDDDILQPVYDFLKKPNGQDFYDLMDSCFDAWCKTAKDELQSELSFEYFEGIAEANEYEFLENGERYS